MADVKLVVIRSFGSHPEADVAKAALDAAGIDSMIEADTAGGMREHLAWSGAGFKILVREEDAAEAEEVLSPPDEGEIPDGGPDDPPSWRLPDGPRD
jgi:putative signal transducing protein